MSDEKGCREAFEAWARLNINLDLSRVVIAPDQYADGFTQHAWLSWQAAWSSRPAPQVEDLVKALTNLVKAVTNSTLYPSPDSSRELAHKLSDARAALAAYRKD